MEGNSSQQATNIYNLEVVFDPKSSFNYHFSYTRKILFYYFQYQSQDGAAAVSRGHSYFKDFITNYRWLITDLLFVGCPEPLFTQNAMDMLQQTCRFIVNSLHTRKEWHLSRAFLCVSSHRRELH